MGIYIFNLRIGEIVVGFSLVASLVLVIYFLIVRKNSIIQYELAINFGLIVLSFFIVLIISGSQIFELYTYKSSSYIWTTSIFFLGILYYKYSSVDLDKILVKLLNPVLFVAYLMQVFIIPDSLVNFFLSISDKFEPHKGSDLTLLFVITFLLNDKYYKNHKFFSTYYVLFSSLYLPFLYYKSRASFIAVLLFIIFQFLKNRNIYFKQTSPLKIILILIVSVIIFLQSVFWVRQSGIIVIYEARENVVKLVEHRTKTFVKESPGLFWISDGKLRTADGNLMWRLDIWQDIIYDLSDNDKALFGYGYNDIIPVMKWENGYRLGLDGLNEHVHNNWFNIFARGGLFQLIFYLLFYYFIVTIFYKKKKNLEILFLILPILFVSFFDSSMENSHFPILYYFFLGRELLDTK
tara:strand:- start:3064 stop:4284 length:1221 start_codon:yes stop_codon:yes gene_type:complete